MQQEVGHRAQTHGPRQRLLALLLACGCAATMRLRPIALRQKLSPMRVHLRKQGQSTLLLPKRPVRVQDIVDQRARRDPTSLQPHRINLRQQFRQHDKRRITHPKGQQRHNVKPQTPDPLAAAQIAVGQKSNSC